MGKPTNWTNYRMLKEGEIIRAGDEVLTDSHLGWQPAGHTVGTPAPNPYYTAHRMYRRALSDQDTGQGEESGR